MKVSQLRDLFGLEVVAGAEGPDRDVVDAYCGDLLSDVMANAAPGSVWLTVQGHQNIVAVAVLKEMPAIVLVNGRLPDEEAKSKADGEGVAIMLSPMPAYQLAGQFHEAGIGKALR